MNNKGSTLTMVIIVSAVLIIFAFSLGSLSLSETKHVVYQEKKLQAYYIARSGAESVAAWIIGLDDPTDIINRITNEGIKSKDFEDFFGVGEVYLDINGELSKINIVSTGRVKNSRDRYISDTVKMTLKGKKNSKGKEVKNVMSIGMNATLGNNYEINGDIAAENVDSIYMKKGTHNGEIVNSKYDYESFDYLLTPEAKGVKIDDGWDFDNLNVDNNFHISLDNDGVRNIRIKELILKNNSSITVSGEGIVRLFVTDKIIFGNGTEINSESNNLKLEIYYSGTEDIDFDNNLLFRGDIYIKDGQVKIGNNVSFQGLIFAPRSSIITGSNLTFEGGIIGKYVSIGTNSKISISPYPIIIDGAESNEVTYEFNESWN